jgi:1-acyl-sn-glycerol-3-phosphate acyltransferase
MLEPIIAAAIANGTKLLTGAQSHWMGCAPKDKQRIYFANHSSHLDFVLLWTALPPSLRSRTRPVAASDYWEKGRLRRYLIHRVFRGVVVSRQPFSSQDPLQPMRDALERGDSLILFPEGTRGDGELLQPFKPGIYHLARANPHVELIPVWMDNCYRVMPKRAILPIPLLCSITFGAPTRLGTDEGQAAFLSRLRNQVEELGTV